MKQLTTTIAKLKRDPHHAITVVDLDIGRKVVMNASGDYLTKNYNSVEGFFEKLNQDGILNFEVQDRRKNGSSFQLESKYTIQAEENNQTPVLPMKQEKVHNPEVIQPNLFAGLMGGLNMMDVSHKVGDYPRVLQELAYFKEKNDRLEKDIKKLEIENLRYELDGKKSAVSAESLKSFAPLLTQMLPMLLGNRGGTPQAGLMAPAGELSVLKNQFIEVIKLTPEDVVEYLFAVAQGITTNQQFDSELSELMTKHNLLEE